MTTEQCINRKVYRILELLKSGALNKVHVVDVLPQPSAEIKEQLYVLLDGDTATINIVIEDDGVYKWETISGNEIINRVIVTVDNTSGDPQGTATFEDGVLTLSFTGLKGEQGNTGSSVDYPFELVNNVTEGGVDKALSAEQGKLLKQLIDTLPTRAELDNKANISGYYGGMTVGSAENLVGRGSVEAEYQGIRTSAGSEDIGVGAAMIREMRGKSIVWNQLVQNCSTKSEVYGITRTKVNNYTVHYSGTSTSNTTFTGTDTTINVIKGHKYYAAANGGPSNTYLRGGTGLPVNQNAQKLVLQATENSARTSLGLYISSGISIDNDVSFILIDLTIEFGSTVADALTVEDCERMFPLPYYDYNPGTIVNNSATGIKTVGFNRYNHATGKAVLPGKYSDYPYEYEICGAFESISFEDYAGNVSTPELYNGRFFNVPSPGVLTVVGGNATDTLVHLVWSGWRNYGEPDYAYEPYWENILQLNLKSITGKLNGEGESVPVYPEGMRGAGTAYDYLIVDADGYARGAVKVMESVDLGTLIWGLGGNNTFYSLIIADMDTSSSVEGLLCAKYKPRENRVVLEDKAMYRDAGRVFIQDSGYSDAQTFRTAVSGVLLYYELATPVTYVLDEPIYLGYPVDDFGTEAKLPVDTAELPTGPVRYTVTYPFNAVDPLRRLPMNYISKESAQNLLNAMKSAGIIADFTMTYNATTQEYNFTITAPSDTPQSTNNETE